MMAARKSNTMKYLLIGGVVAVGYYLYTRTSAAGITAGQPNPLEVAGVQSWATGLTGSNAVNFQNALPNLSAADISGLTGLINVWNNGGTPTAAQTSYWQALASRIGLV